MTRRPSSALLALVAGLAGCRWILGIEEDPFAVRPPAEAPDAAVVPPCPDWARPPDRPDASTPDDGPGQRLVFAVRSSNITGVSAKTGSKVGYDIDGVCSCDPRSTFQGEACTTGRPRCDGDGGIDSVTDILGALVPKGEGFDQQTACGRTTLLIVVDRYNGQPDDADVLVSLVPSFGLFLPPGGTPPATRGDCTDRSPNGPEDPISPQWDGNDAWSYRSSDIAPDGTPTRSIRGWVTGGVLVLDQVDRTRPRGMPVTRDLGGRPTELVFGGVLVSLGTPVLSARIVNIGNGRFRLEDGMTGGRASRDDAIDAVGSLIVGGKMLCSTPAIARILADYACSAVDTAMPPESDFSGTPCNALSLGFEFTAETAKLGSPYFRPAVIPSCVALLDGAVCP